MPKQSEVISNRWKITAGIFSLIGLLIAGVVLGVRYSDGNRPVGDASDRKATPAQPFDQSGKANDRGSSPHSAEFVDEQSCVECHADIAASYSRSDMSRSWRTVGEGLSDTSLMQADFTGDMVVDEPVSGYRYRAYQQDGRVYQEETLIDSRLLPGHKLPIEARYAVGSGHHAQAYVAEQNGYLTMLPLNWFSGEGKWKLSPGYELKNRRFERAILPGCVACHGTVADVILPTQNRYHQPVIDGIGCQRCHGPGEKHVAFQRARSSNASHPHDGMKDSIVNPQRLSAERGNDVCLQCHLMGDISIQQPGKEDFDFRPGDNLREHRLDFLMKTDRPETFGVASHGARIMQSRCYLKSDKKLTCFRCHDPHVPVAEVPKAFFDARCIDCHEPQACSRQVAENELKPPAGCVDCHMPRRSTREGQHIVSTDHLIRRGTGSPRDDGPPVQSGPTPANAEVELVSVWPTEIWPEMQSDSQRLGSAYIQLHELLTPQLPALERGVDLLQKEHQRGQLDADAGYWLGSGLIDLRRPDEAIPFLEAVVASRPDFAQARFRLGIAYDVSQRHDAAMREYKKLIADADDFLDPYSPLVRIHLSRGDFAEAVHLLEKKHRFSITAESLSELTVAKFFSGRSPQECLTFVKQAQQLDPKLIQAHVTEAQIRTVLNQKELAAECYRRALLIDPSHAAARAGLQELEAANDK